MKYPTIGTGDLEQASNGRYSTDTNSTQNILMSAEKELRRRWRKREGERKERRRERERKNMISR